MRTLAQVQFRISFWWFDSVVFLLPQSVQTIQMGKVALCCQAFPHKSRGVGSYSVKTIDAKESV